MSRPKNPVRLCMAPGCDRLARVRDRCQRCYHREYRAPLKALAKAERRKLFPWDDEGLRSPAPYPLPPWDPAAVVRRQWFTELPGGVE